MRIKGPAYSLRDAREEWGAFRIPSIEALIQIGKVTRSIEVRREGAQTWLPIGQIPELAELFDGGGGEAGSGKALGRKPTPSPVAASPAKTPSRPIITPPSNLAESPEPSFAELEAPGVLTSAPEPPPAPVAAASDYKAICADGTMLGPMPLPLLLAHIWDGRVGGADLISRDAGQWLPANQLPELAKAFEKAAAPEARSSSPALPAPTPSPMPVSARAPSLPPTSSPLISLQPPVQVAAAAAALDAARAHTPPPQRLASPLLPAPPPRGPLKPPPPQSEDEAPTEVMSKQQLESVDVKGRGIRLGDGDQPVLSGRLEQVPLVKVLGRILRTGLTGRLVLEGPFRLVLRCNAGTVVAAEREPRSDEQERFAAELLHIPETALAAATGQDDSLSASLQASGAIDASTARSLSSLASFEEALAPFGWRSGSYAFVAAPEPSTPEFHVHGFDLLRAGISVGFTLDEMEAAVGGWTHAAISPGTGPATVDPESMPLTAEERQLLDLVVAGRSFGDTVEEAGKSLGLPRPLVLRTLYTMYHLGMLTLVSGRTHSSASAVAQGIYDPTLPTDVLVRNVQEADFFALLGLARSDEPGDVHAAFQRARAQVRSLTGDPRQIERILARLEKAHRCLADPGLRKLYLEQGEQAIPSEPGTTRVATPLPVDSAVRIGLGSTSTPSMPVIQARTASQDLSGILRTSSGSPRTTSQLEILQAQNFEKARRHIEGKQYSEAVLLLRQLVKVSPMVGRYQAYLGWALYLSGKQTVEDAMTAKSAMDQAINLDLEDPDSYYFRGMLHLRMESQRKARQDFQQALELNREHAAAREALLRLEEAARTTVGTKERTQVGLALGAFVAVFASLFVVANFVGYDPKAAVDGFAVQEYYYHPTSWFFYVRRGTLLVLGLLLTFLLFKRQKSQHVVGYTFLGIAFGLVLGYLCYSLYGMRFPKGEVPDVSLVMLMVVLHAFGEEFFFRSVLTRALLPFFSQVLSGAIVAALLYGLYHLSYVSYWWGLHFFHPGMLLGSMPIQVINIAATVGLPLSLLYGKSRSVVPGISAQLAFGWTFLVLAILHAQG